MNCPKCRGQLIVELFHGVSVNICSQCHGIWFDKGELKRAKDNTDDNLRWLDFDLFEEKEGKYIKKERVKICPRDTTKMDTCHYSESEVVIDMCPVCHGIWLDYHEFEKIMKFLHNKIYSGSSKEYSKDAIDELMKIAVDHDEKISEIKDFLAVLRLFESRFVIENPNIIELNKFLYTYLPLK